MSNCIVESDPTMENETIGTRCYPLSYIWNAYTVGVDLNIEKFVTNGCGRHIVEGYGG